MRTFKRYSALAFASVLTVGGLSFSAVAQPVVVYDNSDRPQLTGYYPNPGREHGDQITFAPIPAGYNTVTDFKFDFYLGGANRSFGETATLSFYANDGALVNPSAPGSAKPGTLLYSQTFFLSPGAQDSAHGTGYNNIDDAGLSVVVPNSFTWTVLFGGLAANEQIGLLTYTTPSVGSSANDFWQKDASGNWVIQNFGASGPVANFGATVTAIPEPATLQLALVGGLCWVGYLARRKQQA